MFERTEFEDTNSASQRGLKRLADYGLLDEKITVLSAPVAHCYFVAKEKDGEKKLIGYLKEMGVYEEPKAEKPEFDPSDYFGSDTYFFS